MNKSEKFWDSRAKYYEGQEGKELKENRAFEETKKHLKDTYVVLDFGCGVGLISNEIAKMVKEVHGIDISSKMIEFAKNNAAELKIKNVNFSKATIFDNEYKNETFDVITAYSVLHLLEDPNPDVRKINKLLKPGGLFISETPCLGQKKGFVSSFLTFLSKIKLVPKIKPLKFSDIENLLEENNFQIIEKKEFVDTVPNYFIVVKKK